MKKFMEELFNSACKQYAGVGKKKDIIEGLLEDAKTMVLPFSLMHQEKQ